MVVVVGADVVEIRVLVDGFVVVVAVVIGRDVIDNPVVLIFVAIGVVDNPVDIGTKVLPET